MLNDMQIFNKITKTGDKVWSASTMLLTNASYILIRESTATFLSWRHMPVQITDCCLYKSVGLYCMDRVNREFLNKGKAKISLQALIRRLIDFYSHAFCASIVDYIFPQCMYINRFQKIPNFRKICVFICSLNNDTLNIY